MQIAYQADDRVRAALARIGRTEDAHFSPSGRRLALAGLNDNVVLVLGVRIAPDGATPAVTLTGWLEVTTTGFRAPHGLFWLDERILIVCSRYGEIMILDVPEEGGRVELTPIRTIGADLADLVRTPGSISAAPVALGLIELIVCNNYVHYVSRHLLDQRNGYALIASDVLVADGLHVPDGIARSPSGRWLAISNHGHHNVLIFEEDGTLGFGSTPCGILSGMAYPHGLRFTPDERALLVADAGAPVIHVFRRDDGAWTGGGEPDASVPAMDDATFRRGHRNPLEGGPKGLAMTADGRLLAVTCEEQVLAFFDLPALAGEAAAPRRDPRPEDERARAVLLRYLAAARPGVEAATRGIRHASDLEMRKLVESRSWRMTAPLRRLGATIRKPR